MLEATEGASAWSVTDYLVAVAAERADLAAEVTYTMAPGGRRPKWKRLHIPRPGEEPEKPKRVTPGELAQMMKGG